MPFLYGLALLLLSSIVSILNWDLFIKIIHIIGIGSIIFSGLFLRTFTGGREYFHVNSEPNEERKNKKIGLVIALFGLPFWVTSILILLF